MQNSSCFKVIGLTGGIASGKTTVSKMLESLGADIIDVDKIAHKLVELKRPAYCMIKETFGANFLLEDGCIDRKKLGELIFEDSVQREKLNGIMFPLLRLEIINEIENLKLNGAKVVIVDAALLYEAGWDALVDETWVVYVSLSEQLKRLMKRDGITLKMALIKRKSQISQTDRKISADNVIDNSNGLENTRKQVERLWEDI